MLASIVERRSPAPGHVELLVEAPGLGQALPGQFLHIWTPGSLRRPISFSRLDGADQAGLMFRVVGSGTAWLAERAVGESLDVLGPLGRGFPVPAPGALCLVGGGVGIPPLFACAAAWARDHATTVVLGARSAHQMLMVEDFRRIGCDPLVMTDDGTLGGQGSVMGPLARWLRDTEGQAGTVMACGPVPMLRETARLVGGTRPLYLAFEQRMGCGVGACLACVVPGFTDLGVPGWLRVCHDGPVFSATRLRWDS